MNKPYLLSLMERPKGGIKGNKRIYIRSKIGDNSKIKYYKQRMYELISSKVVK